MLMVGTDPVVVERQLRDGELCCPDCGGRLARWGHGRVRAILETGTAQPEAMAMYHAVGYQLIENFGHYRDEPGCRSFGREL